VKACKPSSNYPDSGDENLGLVICLNSKALLGIEASTQTQLQLAQDDFNHWMPQIAVGLFVITPLLVKKSASPFSAPVGTLSRV
jgi:hypothetical protein